MKKRILLFFCSSVLGNLAYAQVEINADYGGYGGEIIAREAEGPDYLRIQPDANGAGGYFSVKNGESDVSFEIDGNSGGGGQTKVSIEGISSTYFNTYDTGNNSLVLPNNAVSSTEILNEPGVAMNDYTNTYTLNSTLSSYMNRTITAPSSGYVLVMAAGRFGIYHSNGTEDDGEFGLSSNGTTFAQSQDLDIKIPSSQPSGTFNIPFSAQSVFPVGSGSHTFHLLASETTGNIDIADITLTCLFIPTKYGTVSSEVVILSQNNEKDDAKTVSMQPAITMAQEKDSSIAENLARIQKEMDELKALITSQKTDGNNLNSRK